MILALLACEPEGADTAVAPFYVESVSPAEGEVVDTNIAVVLLQLSEAPDLSRCTTDTIRVDAVRDDGSVAHTVPIALSLSGQALVKAAPQEPFTFGWTYAVTAQGGSDGCQAESGTPLTSILSTFEVP